MPDLTPFDGVHPADNFMRLLLVLLAIPMFMVCVKVSWSTWHSGEPERMWAALAYGLIILAPAIGPLFNFGEPLGIYWGYAALYFAGLVCAGISLWYQVEILVPWWSRKARRERREARAARRAAKADHGKEPTHRG